MTKYVHILLWVPLLYGVLFFILWVHIYQNDIISFEQYVLNKQVNYAAESAIDELLSSGHLSQDYNHSDFQTYEPELARRDYAATLAMDMGATPTDNIITNICNTKIRAMLVCVYDGIYFYYPQKTETNTFELTQSPKVPYFYTSDSGQQFCLTLNPDKGYWDSGDNAGSYSLHDYDKYPDNIKPSQSQQALAINNQVGDILNWALFESYASSKGKRDVQIEIPAIANTVKGDQTVNAPTVIAVVDGVEKVFSTYLTAQAIGGAQIEDPDHIVGYTLNNAVINGVSFTGKYYAKSSWWEKHISLMSNASDGHYFDDVYEAARSGYKNLNLL